MHLPLYLTASLVGDLRRTCQPTSHGRIRVPCRALPLFFYHPLLSSLLFSLRFSRSSSVWSLSPPSLPGGPIHKTGTMSQAAGHPVTRRDPFEVFENANSRDRTPNEISRCAYPRVVYLFPLPSLAPHCNMVARCVGCALKWKRITNCGGFYRRREIIARLLARNIYNGRISFSSDRKTSRFQEDYSPL